MDIRRVEIVSVPRVGEAVQQLDQIRLRTCVLACHGLLWLRVDRSINPIAPNSSKMPVRPCPARLVHAAPYGIGKVAWKLT